MFVMPLLATAKWSRAAAAISAGILVLIVSTTGQANPAFWKLEWPSTDFSKSNVPFDEIFSGGVPKDGIPPIDNPRFASIAEVESLYKGTEPVITVNINGAARAYPLGILMTHEIVNDELGGKPITVTFCPLCNSAIVFDRLVDGKVYDFGVSGKLRNSDLIMWDRQTQSWWQQFTGEGTEGTTFGDVPLMAETKLEVWDSPNSAGVVIDAIRCVKLALDRGVGGPLLEASAYFMKSPPEQWRDEVARERLETYIAG